MSYPLKHALVSLVIGLTLFAVLFGVTLLVWPGLLTSVAGIVAASLAGSVCGMVGLFAAYVILEMSERRHAAHPDSKDGGR